MPIELRTLCQMVKSPDADEFNIVRRHYCTQMYLNNLCTTHCLEQCSQTIQRAFDLSRGEFVINPYGALVMALRTLVHQAVSQSRVNQAETPTNSLGEPTPTADVFSELSKQYEAASSQRRA